MIILLKPGFHSHQEYICLLKHYIFKKDLYSGEFSEKNILKY